ncbi:MAG: PD40 domain-containing protein [Bacteroidales bacterium]|nr:PD40 domain-containing protein [Bacteroidales bacterium]
MKNLIYFIIAVLCVSGCKPGVNSVVKLEVTPEIWPDYKDVTVPAEIAPMNFDFTGDSYHYLFLRVKGSNSGELETEGKKIEMDINDWHNLTAQNKGGSLDFYLSVVKDGVKTDYAPFKMYVSEYPLEEYGLTYRRIPPGYVSYGKMGIYCRNISNFQEDVILENTAVYGICVNCHTANKTDPKDFVFHVRGQEYGGTVIQHNGRHKIYNTKTNKTLGAAVYPYWHNSGRFVAFSTNQTFQVFHTANPKRIEVFDKNSDLQIYDAEKEEFVLSEGIKNDSLMETFPVFSADGKDLIFCQTDLLTPPYYLEDIHYSIMKASFDEKTGKVSSEKDTLVCHKGKSAIFPRPSYDGKYLMYTVCDYGTFPIWHKEADLYLYNFEDSTSRVMEEVNSDFSDSFHNWSSNSKWFVFTSRRIDGLFTRLYIASIGDDGKCTKPFLLPQKNPLEYYNSLFTSYNTPDFTKTAVDVSKISLRNRIESKERENITVRE